MINGMFYAALLSTNGHLFPLSSTEGENIADVVNLTYKQVTLYCANGGTVQNGTVVAIIRTADTTAVRELNPGNGAWMTVDKPCCLPDDSYLELRRSFASIQASLHEEQWRRYVRAHPEKNLAGSTWAGLARFLCHDCTSSENPESNCRGRPLGGGEVSPCVYCGREPEE